MNDTDDTDLGLLARIAIGPAFYWLVWARDCWKSPDPNNPARICGLPPACRIGLCEAHHVEFCLEGARRAA